MSDKKCNLSKDKVFASDPYSTPQPKPGPHDPTDEIEKRIVPENQTLTTQTPPSGPNDPYNEASRRK